MPAGQGVGNAAERCLEVNRERAVFALCGVRERAAQRGERGRLGEDSGLRPLSSECVELSAMAYPRRLDRAKDRKRYALARSL